MRKLTWGLIASLVLAAAIGWLFQRSEAAELQGRSVALREREAEVSRLRVENHRLERLRIPSSELERLRRDQRELEALQIECARLAAPGRRAAAATDAGSPVPKPLAAGMTALAALVDDGIATPEAAALRFFRAVEKMDPKEMAAQMVFAKDAASKAREYFGGLDEATQQAYGSPQEMMASCLIAALGRVAGVQMLPVKDLGPNPDLRLWNAQLQMMNGSIRQFEFPVYRTPDGWREIVPIEWVDAAIKEMERKPAPGPRYPPEKP